MFVGFKEIEGMSSWAFALVFILFLLGFFPFSALFFVGAVWALALFFGKGHIG